LGRYLNNRIATRHGSFTRITAAQSPRLKVP
jgi:hypothetical protein